jgi:hypothetical protein
MDDVGKKKRHDADVEIVVEIRGGDMLGRMS